MARMSSSEEKDIFMKEGGSVPGVVFDPSFGGILLDNEVYQSVLNEMRSNEFGTLGTSGHK